MTGDLFLAGGMLALFVVAVGLAARALIRLRARHLLDLALAQSFDRVLAAAAGSGGVAIEAPAPGTMAAEEEGQPIVLLANRIIEDAYARGASHVHIEPRETELVVRFRIDGCLEDRMKLPARAAEPLVQRLKLMGGGEITERRLPQDCRIHFKKFSRTRLELDLRLATFPTRHGETCVLRLCARHSIALGLADLGFTPANLELVRHATNSGPGLVVFACPAGSGARTTLFSAVGEIAARGASVLGVGDDFDLHDPPGVTALRLDQRLSAARALAAWRAMDPDAVAVTDLDDPGIAKEAFAAAASGRVVVGTLLADDAPGAVRRLIGLGVDPYVVRSSLRLVVAQRLCRRLCNSCKVPRAPTDHERDELFSASPGGCERCQSPSGKGYKGRVAIHEVLAFNDEIRALVGESAAEEALASAARRNGMKTLREDGLVKVREGVTDLAELRTVPTHCIGDDRRAGSTREAFA